MSQATARQFTLRVRGALKSRSACSPDPHAGLARGDEAVGTTVSLVRWQLQPGLAGPLPVPRGLAEESACPSGDRARAAPAPEGWLRWSQQLASGSLASRGLTSEAWVEMHRGAPPSKETVDASLIGSSQVQRSHRRNREIKFKLQR